MNSRTAEGLAALAFFLVGGFFVWEAFRLGVGELSEPGAGMLPALAAGLLAVLSFIKIVTLSVKGEGKDPITFTRSTALRLVGAVAAIIAMSVLMPRIGFFASSGAMLFFFFYAIAALPLVRAALMTVAVTTVNYVVFAILLKVPFP